jgi:hypothetical protein
MSSGMKGTLAGWLVGQILWYGVLVPAGVVKLYPWYVELLSLAITFSMCVILYMMFALCTRQDMKLSKSPRMELESHEMAKLETLLNGHKERALRQYIEELLSEAYLRGRREAMADHVTPQPQ